MGKRYSSMEFGSCKKREREERRKKMKSKSKKAMWSSPRPPVLRPVRFTPKTAYNRQKIKNKKEWQ